MTKQYYRFIEHNEWEGETWTCFVNLFQEEAIKLKSLVDEFGDEFFEFYLKPISQEKVDACREFAHQGYMPSHTKSKGLAVDLDKIKTEEDFHDTFNKLGAFL